MPSPNRITIPTLAPALQNLVFLLFIAAGDLLLFIFDLYLESGGAKLALPSLKWPKEIIAIFTLVGIPSNYISPPIVVGLLITIASIGGAFMVAHYTIWILGSVQRLFPSLLQVQQGRKPDDVHKLVDEAYPLLQAFLLTIFIGIITFGLIFPNWTQPLAQLQIAHKIWPSDFQIVPQGNSIVAAQQAVPNMNTILQRHEGEFSKRIVLGLPTALLLMHILFGFLTEMYLLHLIMHAGNIETRTAEVVHRLNQGLIINPYNRINTAIVSIASQIRKFREGFLRGSMENHGLNLVESHQEVVPESQEQNPNLSDGNEVANLESNENRSTEEPHDFNENDVDSEDRPVRVIGGGEVMTPREARRFPEFYVIEEERDEETGELSYRIYTREFHEELQTQNT